MSRIDNEFSVAPLGTPVLTDTGPHLSTPQRDVNDILSEETQRILDAIRRVGSVVSFLEDNSIPVVTQELLHAIAVDLENKKPMESLENLKNWFRSFGITDFAANPGEMFVRSQEYAKVYIAEGMKKDITSVQAQDVARICLTE